MKQGNDVKDVDANLVEHFEHTILQIWMPC